MAWPWRYRPRRREQLFVPRRRRQTQAAFRDELPRLLQEQGISQRQLAAAIDLPQSYISLVLGGRRSPSKRLLEQAAHELGLPIDYFAEYREQVAIAAIKTDGALRDRIYRSLTQRKRS